jgi:drug/metabolite transporter (DMT)-like permease
MLPVHIALLWVQLSFGAYHVLGKVVLAAVDPFALAGLRVLVATPALAALAWALERHRPARQDLAPLALLGLLGVAANQLLFVVGLRGTTATSASILMPSVPVFTAAVAALLGIERLTPARAAGVLAAVAGALVLLDPGRLDPSREARLGNALILVNCLAYALFLVLQRPVLRRVPPLTLTAAAHALGGLVVVPVCAPAMLAVRWSELSGATMLGLAYIVGVATVLNYALVTWAVGRSSPGLVSAYITLQPLAASALASAFLGERPGGAQVVGFALITAGLVLVSAGRRAPAVHRSAAP